MTHADSAGRPWAGREFEHNAWTADDGSAPAAYAAAVTALHEGSVDVVAVVDALRDARLLVALLAEVGEFGTDDAGRRHDRRAELSLVTVAGPDGRAVLPAFSSAAAMAAWNRAARPVPAPARQVALGAASDGTELVIIDPASPRRFGLRRGAIEALARGSDWLPSWRDPEVGRALRHAAADEPAVVTVRVQAGDPRCSLDDAEVRTVVVLAESLDRAGLDALLGRLRAAWSADPIVTARVDSLAVRVEAAVC